jgi:GTP-binding protein
MAKTPTVAIVGRPNVGKSSLFNAMYGGRVAIVEPTPGVTRDRISRVIDHDGARFELIDTGGIGLHDLDELADDIHMQISIALEEADLVLLVVDAREGLQPADQDITQQLREAGKRTMLVVNKCDGPRDEEAAVDFYALGFDDMHLTAAEHRRGVRQLIDDVVEALPEAREAGLGEEQPEPMKIALVGRRNVGKSSLVNHLAQQPRCVVSEIPGTTRDSIDVRFRFGNLDFIAIDTAGLRRSKQVKDSIDFYSSARSRAAIERADVVVHIIEAPMEVGKLDKQLVAEVVDQHKPCVVAVNKMDLAPDVSYEQFEEYIRDRLPGVAFAPVVCISALTGENVVYLIEAAQVLHEQSFVRVQTAELNKVMQEATKRVHPPSTKTQFGRIYYATQVGTKPPTIALFTNEPKLITATYQRYLANRLRESFGFSAIPIRFLIRGRKESGPKGRPVKDGR